MAVVDIDGFAFNIPDNFLATKYDDWGFYRNYVNRIDGAKAVDLIIVARDASIAFLVEVKDFRVNTATLERRTRTKPSELSDEVAAKVLHSLGGILAARIHAVIDIERDAAAMTCRVPILRVVLHLEQSSGSRLFPKIVNPANLQIKLRRILKAVDPHAIVVSRTNTGRLPWRVD